MAGKEEAKTESDAEKSAEGEQPEAKGLIAKLKSNKKLLIIIILVLLLLIGGGVFLMTKKKADTDNKNDAEAASEAGHGSANGGDSKGKEGGGHGDSKKTPDAGPPQEVFMDLEQFIVNLNRGDKQPSFLKMTVTLQIPSQQVADKINGKMPIIIDAFQTYLRELRPEDLQGSAGLFRLREELTLRINKVMYPDTVIDILFKEVLVQ
jgi:flagellar FliL protein